MAIRQKQGWEIPESLATPEDIFLNRRNCVALSVRMSGKSGHAP